MFHSIFTLSLPAICVGVISFFVLLFTIAVFVVVHLRRARYNKIISILKVLPTTSVIFDKKLKILEIINPSNNALGEIKLSQLKGCMAYDTINMHPELTESGKVICKNAKSTVKANRIHKFEYKTKKDGIDFLAKGLTAPLLEHYVIFLSQDYSDYVEEAKEVQRKEEELAKLEHQLLLALEAGKTSAWCYDVEKQYFSSLQGQTLSRDSKSLKDTLAAMFPDDRQAFKQLIKDLANGVKKKGSLICRFYENGQIEWYETHAIASKSNTNNTITKIIGTEKKLTESILKQKALKDAQSKLKIVFESADMCSWEMDAKTQVFNQINSKNIPNKQLMLTEYLTYIHPDDLNLVEQGLLGLFDGRKRMMDIHIRMTFPQKEQRWYQVHATVSDYDSNGHVSNIIGIQRDITEIMISNEMIVLRKKAEESNRLKSAFLANMSHEIRTPLNAIVGFSQLIVDADTQGERDSYYEIIESNNELLLQLISDILDISKIEAGELDYAYSKFDLASVFERLEKIYKPKVPADVQIITELPKDNCIILLDKNRLTQVITNFLNNACKFTSKGHIKMGYSYIENGLRFFVEDTGKGIQEENLPKVFERFSKFDPTVTGTGLGLPICKSIVNYFEGQIGVTSEFGKGTEFWFTIPCTPIILK